MSLTNKVKETVYIILRPLHFHLGGHKLFQKHDKIRELTKSKWIRVKFKTIF